jgi:transposase
METLSPTDIIALRQELAVAVVRAGKSEVKAAEARADAANSRAINADLEARFALQIELLKRDRFGQRSERSRRLIDQLELAFEATTAADEAAAIAAAKTTAVIAFVRARPSRQPLPAQLPWTRVVIPTPPAVPVVTRISCRSSARISPRRSR